LSALLKRRKEKIFEMKEEGDVLPRKEGFPQRRKTLVLRRLLSFRQKKEGRKGKEVILSRRREKKRKEEREKS